MPTYEFRCPDGHEFEKFYRTISSAQSEAVCPACGLPAERMMSATGFAFKGSGFYLTDYGKNAHRGEAPPVAGAGDSSPASASDTPSSKSDGGSSDAKATSDKKDTSSATPAPSTESKKADSKPAVEKPAAKPSKPTSGE